MLDLQSSLCTACDIAEHHLGTQLLPCTSCAMVIMLQALGKGFQPHQQKHRNTQDTSREQFGGEHREGAARPR